MRNALAHLCLLADAHKASKHANVPYPVRSKYSDKDANGLTKCVVGFLALSGHFSTRLSSTGTFRADIGKFIPSQQRAGLPDVFAVVEGHAVFVEVKIGRDYLSQEQKQTIADLQNAGASVFVASTFEGFFAWFNARFSPVLPPSSLR